MKNKLMILMLCIMCLVLSGCNKKAISGDTFAAAFDSDKCQVKNLTGDYERETDVVVMDKAYCDTYEMEYYRLDSVQTAKDIFKTNADEFRKDKTGTNLEKDYAEGNYEIYSLTCGGKFRYIARVDDTIIYVYADDTYKKEISKILEKLGY